MKKKLLIFLSVAVCSSVFAESFFSKHSLHSKYHSKSGLHPDTSQTVLASAADSIKKNSSVHKLFVRSNQYGLQSYFASVGSKGYRPSGYRLAFLNIDTGVVYVPYTGATGDLNLGAHGLSTSNIYNGTTTSNILTLKPYSGSGILFNIQQTNANAGYVNLTTVGGTGFATQGVTITDINLLQRDFYAFNTVVHTATTRTQQFNSAAFFATAGAANTQNWTGQLNGINAQATITNGASGTFSRVIGFSNGALNSSTAATVTNLIGGNVYVASSGPATNIMGLQLSTSSAINYTGKWSIYNGLTYANYLGTGNTLINTLTDNGVDKLQITGGLLANGQAHYAAAKTIGALDFMYKQKADSLYAPKTAYAAANDSLVYHKSDTTTTLLTQSKAAMLYQPKLTFGTGLTSTGNVVKNTLLTGITGGQTIYGGIATTDSLVLSPYVGSTMKYRIDQYGIFSGNTRRIPLAPTTYTSAYNWKDNNVGIRDVFINTQVSHTIASRTVPYVALTAWAQVAATNTQNWTSPQSLIAADIESYIYSGATGTVNRSLGAILLSQNASTSATITYSMGASINALGTATNTTVLGINTNITPSIAGNWSVYNNAIYPNYLGTGATLINTTTDNGVDKLQVNGGLLANGQAHYPAAKTIGALDFMYKQKADSLYAPASGLASYVPYTGATGPVNLGANSLTLPRIYGGVATTDTARISPYPTSTAKMLGSDKGFGFTTSGSAATTVNATIQISDLWLNQSTVKRGLFVSSLQSNTTGTTITGSILAATNISIPVTNTGNIGNHIAYNMNVTAVAGATGTVTNFGGNQIFVNNAATGLTATNMFGQIISIANVGPNTNTVGLAIRGASGTPAGKYSLYNDLALPSYTAANTLLGGLTDNGVDKLQITGGLLANGQAHYGAGRTLGALDFMYKQKADSTYAAKTDLVTFSTGLTNTGGVVTNNLSTGVAGGQSVIGGKVATDSLVLSPYVGATSKFRIDQYGVFSGNTTRSPLAPTTFTSAYNWKDNNVQIRDIYINSQVSHTTAPRGASYIALTAWANVAATNTQNWNGPQSLMAANIQSTIYSGASGTFTRSLGALIVSQNESTSATVAYNVGASIISSGNATNTTVLGLNNAINALVAGNWSIYNNATYANYLGTGATLINTITDNGVDKLQVNGTIHAKGVKVDLNFAAPDYVFDADYKLASLPEVKKYIAANHHLAEIPSAQQIEKEGMDLGDMNAKLLKKVEELTLYLIQKDEEIKQQKKELIKIKKKLRLK